MNLKQKLQLYILKRYFNILKYPNQKISFSQSGEDLIIKYLFDCMNINKPSFIDIGACKPFLFNNTALFYINGSRGINIEPDPFLFKELKENRKEDINLNIGIASRKQTSDFYILSNKFLNTFSKEEAEKTCKEGNHKIEKIIQVQLDTVENIIKKHFSDIFPDLLSLDAESMEEEIIHSINFENSSPKIICTETLSYYDSGNGERKNKISEFLNEKGYILYADTNINLIFIKKECWVK